MSIPNQDHGDPAPRERKPITSKLMMGVPKQVKPAWDHRRFDILTMSTSLAYSSSSGPSSDMAL